MNPRGEPKLSTGPPGPRGKPATVASLGHEAITAHVLRHTTAMRLLQAGVDTSVIALWLSHASVETTQIYLEVR